MCIHYSSDGHSVMRIPPEYLFMVLKTVSVLEPPCLGDDLIYVRRSSYS